ncbi:SusC/RagA family TonB-linked outer membrane protein [Ekhidna sp.]
MKKNYILQKVRIALLAIFSLASSFTLLAQQTVSGRVTDENGEGLPGVTILVKGTNSGDVTDVDGNFTINASSSDVLVFSSIGFQTQEIPINNQTSIAVNLQTDLQSLQEVVVLGYGSQSREEFTGSIAVVPVAEALKLPVANVSEALQGRAPGVSVITQGQPGEAPEVRIRGFASPNGNDPLYIIDGMQTTDPTIMNDINPADVESIQVLKDAASTAIYGVRASNGIVIVTTKRGQVSGKPKLSFEAFAGVQNPTNFPDLLSAQQWADAFGDGTIPQYLGSPNENQPYNFDTNRITPTSSGGTDWVDEIFDPASFQNYYLSAQGGTDRGRYMMSVGYLDKEGVVLNTGYDRFSGRINSEFNILDNLRIGQHLNISTSNQQDIPREASDDNPISLASRIHPFIPVRDQGGNFAGNAVAGLGNAANPVAALERANALGNNLQSFRTFGDAYLEFDPIEDLTFKTTLGINNRVDRRRTVTPQNPEHSEPITTTQLTEDTYEQFSWVWSNTATYTKSFDNHNFKALIGVESVKDQITKRQVIGREFFLETENFVQIQAAQEISVPIGDPTNGRPNEEISTSLASVFGSLNYNYDRKYFASFSVRRDQTSRFTDANNTGVFPSASVAWAVHKESFLEGNSTISNLKLRFSFGETGNQSISRSNPTVDLFGFASEQSAYDIDGSGSGEAVGIVQTQIGNPDLTWETSRQINFGVDFGMLQNDLNVSLDIYKINTEDMIFAPLVAGLPAVTTAPVVNIGEMENRGFDLSISYGNYSKGGAVKYDITANVSAYKNELVAFNDESAESFPGDVYRGSSFTRTDVGNPISYFYGLDVIGIFQNETEVANSPDQGFATNADGVGRFRYRDVDGDGDIDADDRTNLGSPHPDFVFGLNAYVEYKNFDISLFVTGSQGNEIYNQTKFFTDFPQFDGNRSTRILDSWTPNNPGASLPSLDGNGADNGETNPNSYFVEDGSYVRLKNLQIGYNLPQSVLSSVKGLESLRVYIQGTNLFTITDYNGFDPEITNRNASAQPNLSMGVDFGRFPLTQVYTIGVKAGF